VSEIVVVVEEDPEGDWHAQGVGQSIFTDADDFDSLRWNVRDAVECHFPDPDTRPKMIRLHVV
jgi:hypothetical protein